MPAGADDLDPAHRMLRVRAETTKTRREQAGPHSAPTGVPAAGYLRHRAAVSPAVSCNILTCPAGNWQRN